MGKAALVEAFAVINAAIAALDAEVDGSDFGSSSDADPLAGLADDCLDILSGAAGVEARVAGLKARAAAKYAQTAHAVAPPDAPVQALEMAVAAEIGCVLAIGGRAAGAFVATSHAVTTSLPRSLAALQAGTMSWRHAVAMADETASLDEAGAAALEAHFLDPDAPNPSRGCPIGEMPASRFRHKARIWRERHHKESIEERHGKCVLDRRVEYAPDRDGMAWLSPTCPRTRPWGYGIGSQPSPGVCRDRMSPAPSPSCGPTLILPLSSAAETAATGPRQHRRRRWGGRS